MRGVEVGWRGGNEIVEIFRLAKRGPSKTQPFLPTYGLDLFWEPDRSSWCAPPARGCPVGLFFHLERHLKHITLPRNGGTFNALPAVSFIARVWMRQKLEQKGARKVASSKERPQRNAQQQQVMLKGQTWSRARKKAGNFGAWGPCLEGSMMRLN